RSATMPSCCGITPGSVLCTGSPPARSRSWSVEPPSVAVAPHSALRTRRATAPHFLLQRRSEPRVPSFSARLAVAATLCSCGLMRPASAQRLDAGAPPPPAPLSGSTAEAYEPVFEALRRLAPRADSVATVHNLTLQRDAIQFHFAEGRPYLLPPVA